ncbi:MAG: hypothetical protein HY815_05445 [Candidatus Riflebacteria bacterium]|nr:hypothetical protein [Candidatus Riflebacteria bacterium]
MKYLLHTPLLIWTTAEIRRLEDPQAQVATDQVLGSALLPGGGKGLARIAAERGASVAMLGDFARLLHLGSIGKAITDQTTRDVAVLEQQEQAASNLPLKVIARNRIARVQEDAAARLLVLLQQLRPSVESMAMNVTTQALGNPLPPREQRRDAVVLVGNTHDSMFIQMRGALSRAMEVGQENRLCAGERVKAYQRVLRIAKLESLAGPWPNRNREALRTYIRGLSEFYKHRIPNLEHFFNVEDERLDSPETRYPLYPATQDVCKLRESFAQLCIRLLLLGSEATS